MCLFDCKTQSLFWLENSLLSKFCYPNTKLNLHQKYISRHFYIGLQTWQWIFIFNEKVLLFLRTYSCGYPAAKPNFSFEQKRLFFWHFILPGKFIAFKIVLPKCKTQFSLNNIFLGIFTWFSKHENQFSSPTNKCCCFYEHFHVVTQQRNLIFPFGKK